MRCHNCKRKVRKGARFCAQCGAEIKEKRSDPISRCINRALAVIICCALFIAAVCFLNAWLESRREGQSAYAPDRSDAPKPTQTPQPTATYPPRDRPKRIPTRAPTQKPLYTPNPRPTPSPTPSPSPTPVPTPTAIVWQEDLTPVDALIEFIFTGDPAMARKAFPPQYISFKVSGYGYAVGIMGGEDGVIRSIGKMITSSITMQYGRLNSITYDIISRRTLSIAELAEVKSELLAYSITDTVTEAHQLDLKLTVNSSNGTRIMIVSPRVVNIGGSWYIHPDDIDEFTD